MLAVVLLFCAVAPSFAQDTVPSTPKPLIAQALEVLGYDRLEIEIDADGEPTVLGLPVMATARALHLDASKLALDPAFVTMFMDANVQHMEIRQEAGKLGLIVNGKVLPYVSWDSNQLPKVAAVASTIAPSNADLIKMIVGFAPWMDKLGLDVLVSFPVKPGVALIAPSDPAILLPVVNQTATVAKATIDFTVEYSTDGTPGILGFTPRDLANFGLYSDLYLRSDVLQALIDAGVQNLELRTRSDGFIVFSNNEPLISLNYDAQMLENAANLFVQVNPTSPYSSTISNAVSLTELNLGIMATFPVAPGTEPIELVPHPNAVPSTVTVVKVDEPAEAAATPTPSASPAATPVATPSATPAPVLVDVTCKDGTIHRGLTPEEAAHACPEGGEGW